MVKDIFPGASSSIYTSPNFTNISGRLFFNADDGNYGVTELWKSDGDTSSTIMVKDIFTGSTFGSSPDDLTNVNGTLYFNAADATNGRELWKSDGTDINTVLIKNINSGTTDSNPEYITNVNGIVYFSASDATNTEGLWKSDGTSSGTIYLGGDVTYAKYLTNVSGKLFFSGYDGTHGQELWTLNTSTGISQIGNLNTSIFIFPNPASSSFTIRSSSQLPNAQVEIYNLLGEKMYSTGLTNKQQTVKIETLVNGIYIVKVKDAGIQCLQKLEVR
jgi:ELWxxDGT repeat protein